jgi:hypothetical protein
MAFRTFRGISALCTTTGDIGRAAMFPGRKLSVGFIAFKISIGILEDSSPSRNQMLSDATGNAFADASLNRKPFG